LLEKYFAYARDMDFREVVRRVSTFDDNERQFLSDMLFATVMADGDVSQVELDLLRKCVDAFMLPMPTKAAEYEKQTDPNAIAPTFLSYSYTCHWSSYGDYWTGSICPHQLPDGEVFHNWLFRYSGTTAFTKWEDTKILKILTEKCHLDGDRKIVMLQDKGKEKTNTRNKVGRVLSGGYDLCDSVDICLISPEGRFEGFTDRSDLIWLVKAIDTIFEGASLAEGSAALTKYPKTNQQQLEFALEHINKLS